MAGKPKSMEVRAIELKQKYNLQQDVKLIEDSISPFYPMVGQKHCGVNMI